MGKHNWFDVLKWGTIVISKMNNDYGNNDYDGDYKSKEELMKCEIDGERLVDICTKFMVLERKF